MKLHETGSISEFAPIQHLTLGQSLKSLTFGHLIRLTSRYLTLAGVVIAGSVPVPLRILRVPVNAHHCPNAETAKRCFLAKLGTPLLHSSEKGVKRAPKVLGTELSVSPVTRVPVKAHQRERCNAVGIS